jgi:hypothetical protein
MELTIFTRNEQKNTVCFPSITTSNTRGSRLFTDIINICLFGIKLWNNDNNDYNQSRRKGDLESTANIFPMFPYSNYHVLSIMSYKNLYHTEYRILGACNENNLIRYLSSVCWVTTPLHVSGLLVAHLQEVAMYIGDNWYVLYVLVDCRRARYLAQFF